jgi:hypothetical protein
MKARKFNPKKIISLALNIQVGDVLMPLPALVKNRVPYGARTVGMCTVSSSEPDVWHFSGIVIYEGVIKGD